MQNSKRLLTALLIALLLAPAQSWAAWAFVGSPGKVSNKASGTTLVLNVSAPGTTAGDVVCVCVAADNVQTTDGQTTLVSLGDQAGNTYTRLLEFTNGQGGAASGATASLHCGIQTTGLSTSQTITATFSSSITAKSMRTTEFSFGAGSTFSVSGSATSADDAVDPPSQTISSLASQEYLWLHCAAHEGPISDVATTSTNYTIMGDAQNSGTTGGSAVTNMSDFGEYRILTATTDTVDIGWAAADGAQVYVALLESAVGGGGASSCNVPIGLMGVGC
jgi:hypothetical protein